MRLIPGLLKRLTISSPSRSPERLWVHYSFAFAMVLGLLLAEMALNRNSGSYNIEVAGAIERNNLQQDHLAQVMSAANAFTSGRAADNSALLEAVETLEDVHVAAAADRLLTPEIQAKFYAEPTPLNNELREYIATARILATGASSRRAEVYLRLEALYRNGSLERRLGVTNSLLAIALAEHTEQQLRLHQIILMAAAAVLLAEALLVFLPTQRAVQSTFRTLRRQTFVLENSRAQLKEANTKLAFMVNHDQLTGLPNRRGLTDYMLDRRDDRYFADCTLLLVGLDDFKSINDTLGPECGDALLMAVGQALASCIDSEDIVAHVGNDEFVLISQEPSKVITQRILTAIGHPFEINGRRVATSASIGYLHIGKTDRMPLAIMADAAVALRFAKAKGPGHTLEYTDDLRDALERQQELQHELRDALTNGEIEPWFQPQVRLEDGKLHGAEVLARWRHPRLGLLSPHEFLPAAAHAGLIVELDHAVWSAALRHAKIWQDDDIWRPCLSLNAAPETISDPSLLERFLLTVRRVGMEADQVVIEVLETTLISGRDDIAAINIDSLAESGIALELDDFGTGYASLSRLTQLPLRGLKLDRTLISPLPDQSADSIVRAVLALAKELGLQVVAEGVEEPAQAAHLAARGCAIAQGYGYGKPMSPADFQTWLTANATEPLQINPPLAAPA